MVAACGFIAERHNIIGTVFAVETRKFVSLNNFTRTSRLEHHLENISRTDTFSENLALLPTMALFPSLTLL